MKGVITLCLLRWLWIQHSKSLDVIELSLMVTDDEWKVHRAKVVHVVQLGAEEVLTMSKWTLTAFSHFCDRLKQDPVSTMQKTGLINYSSFPVWSGLDVITMVQSSIFLCIRPFSAWWHPTEQTNKHQSILEQACSLPVRRRITYNYAHLRSWKYIFCWGEKNDEGKGEQYLEKENITIVGPTNNWTKKLR